MLVELKANCNNHREKLSELLKAYDLAVLGRQVADAHETEISNKVLAEHEFFAKRSFNRAPADIKAGDRITDETFTFLMSDEDFNRFFEIRLPHLVEAKICDEKGYYLTDWVSINVDAMNALVDFIIENIVPAYMRATFAAERRNIVVEKKLIDITRKVFAA